MWSGVRTFLLSPVQLSEKIPASAPRSVNTFHTSVLSGLIFLKFILASWGVGAKGEHKSCEPRLSSYYPVSTLNRRVFSAEKVIQEGKCHEPYYHLSKKGHV